MPRSATHGWIKFIGDSSEIHRSALGCELGARPSGGFTFLSPWACTPGGGAPSYHRCYQLAIYRLRPLPRGAYILGGDGAIDRAARVDVAGVARERYRMILIRSANPSLEPPELAEQFLKPYALDNRPSMGADLLEPGGCPFF